MSSTGHEGSAWLASSSDARSQGSSARPKGHKSFRLSRLFERSRSGRSDTRTETNATSIYSSPVQPRKPATALTSAPVLKSVKPANLDVKAAVPGRSSRTETSKTDGVLQRLGVVIDEMFMFILRKLSEVSIADKYKVGFQNTFQIYRLWEAAFDMRSGGLDGLAKHNQHVLGPLGPTLHSTLRLILRTLLEAILPSLDPDLKPPDYLVPDIKDVLPPAEDYDSESLLPSSNSSSSKTEEDSLHMNFSDLRTYVEWLSDLSPSITEAIETGLHIPLEKDGPPDEGPEIPPEAAGRSGSIPLRIEWFDDLPEGQQQREREEKTWQSQHTSPAAIRRLLELIQIKHSYDMEILSLQESPELEKHGVIELKEKADEVSDEIAEIVQSWEGTESLWGSEEWELTRDIKQRIATSRMRWREDPPPYRSGGTVEGD